MTNLRDLASLLYVPGWNAAAIDSARRLPCHAIILCLEDATPKDRKLEARQTVVTELNRGGFSARHIIVRVNGLDTEWGGDDLAALRNVPPDAILAPGIRDAADVRSYDRLMDCSLWLMLETAEAVLNLKEIAAAALDTRLKAFVMGTNDLAAAFGARPLPTRDVFLPIFSLVISAARAFGLAAYDGIFMNADDDKAFRLQCEQAVQFGFDGKTLFSPRQINVCNELLGPLRATACAR